MHCINPMSVYHFDSLRAEATRILSVRLRQADPPPRKEVVEYMLDSGASVRSLREGKVNMRRLMSILSFLSAIERVRLYLRKEQCLCYNHSLLHFPKS
ncbi:FT-interacting protein 3 [Linum grandiflorum]